MKTVHFVTMFTSLATLALLVAVGAKLQVAKEDFTNAASDFVKNPVNSILAVVRGNMAKT